MNIHFPKNVKKYIKLQCNSELSDYQNCPEVQPIIPFLEKVQPKRVLELGAGLGRISVFLKNYFDWNSTEFYLLDGNSGNEQIAGIHWEIKKDFYNSLEATKTFCIQNGISKDKLFLINAESPWTVDRHIKFDLCYSFKALGFHWPINEYLETLLDNIETNAYLIFEIRNTKEYMYNSTESWKRRCAFVEHQLEYIKKNGKYKVIKRTDARFPLLLMKKL